MKFKCGDRVAFYQSGERYVGNIARVGAIPGHAGDVEVRYEPGSSYFIHHKQCKKLRPKKKPRTVTMWHPVLRTGKYTVDSFRLYETREEAIAHGHGSFKIIGAIPITVHLKDEP